MKSILDPSFKYTKSLETDIRKTFARVKREMAAAGRFRAADTKPLPAAKVTSLRLREKK